MKRSIITEEWLKANGFQKAIFFYAIGDGEDESDCDIFVKDGIALTNEYKTDRWAIADYNDLSYTNGFPEDKIITFIDQIEL